MADRFQPAPTAVVNQPPLLPSDLSRQSGDQLDGHGSSAPKPSTGPPQYMTGTPLDSRDKLLEFQTRRVSANAPVDLLSGPLVPSVHAPQVAAQAAPRKSDGLLYTESELQHRVGEALARAHREAAVLQADSDEMHKRLKAELEISKQMATVVEEYSKAMGDMLAAQGKGAGQDERVAQHERVTQLEADLRSTESAFSDLHAKYNKAKELIETFKQNEVKLKEAVGTAQEAVAAEIKRYDVLKSHAEAKIAEANSEIGSVREHFKSQIQLLTVKAKKAEAEVDSLRRQLEIKEADNKELTSICDDLVKQLDARQA